MLLTQGDVDGAVASYRASVAGQERLLTRDATNVEWRTSMASALASLWKGLKQRPATVHEAAAVRQRALGIVQSLTADGSLDAETRKDLLEQLE